MSNRGGTRRHRNLVDSGFCRPRAIERFPTQQLQRENATCHDAVGGVSVLLHFAAGGCTVPFVHIDAWYREVRWQIERMSSRWATWRRGDAALGILLDSLDDFGTFCLRTSVLLLPTPAPATACVCGVARDWSVTFWWTSFVCRSMVCG